MENCSCLTSSIQRDIDMTRLEKYEIFKQFFATAGEKFNEIHKNYKPHYDLRNSYGFYIVPGSRNGGQDATVVDIFFGNRPYRTSKKIEGMQITTQVEIAHGTSLFYYQLDTGDIFVKLTPAFTDNHKAQEEFVIIDIIKDPKKLLNINFLRKHYKYLVAYLAVTSIENKPTIVDKAMAFYLRMTKRYYNNKTTYEPKIRKYISNIFKLILTVGFSGFLLAFIPLFTNQNRNKEIEKQIEILIEKQNRIIELLNNLNAKTTIEDYGSQLEKIRLEIENLNSNINKDVKKEK
jgi:hypothetical protein